MKPTKEAPRSINDDDDDFEDGSGMTFFNGLVAGAVVGAVFGVLFAPRAGATLRRQIFRSAARNGKTVARTVEQLAEGGAELYERARDVITRTSDEVERVAAGVSKHVDRGLAVANDVMAARSRRA